jgi:hypothetical protein
VDRVVLDTDIASLSQKGRLPELLAHHLERYEWCVTFVTLGELAKWGELHNWGIRRWTKLADWAGQTVVLRSTTQRPTPGASWLPLHSVGAGRGRSTTPG